MTTDFDVAIVGGGPAGTSTALHLVRREGVRAPRIVVLDKAKFPREKPCAGAISQLGVETLATLGVAIDVPHVPMDGLRILWAGEVGETVAPLGVIVRRSELDARLLEHVRADGVVVRDGEAVTEVTRTGEGFRLTTARGSLTARTIAACDGAGSSTRKLLGIHEVERKGHLYVLETEARAADEGPRRRLVDFDLDVLGDGLQGYYWDFPTVIDGAPMISRGIYHANVKPSSSVKAALARSLARRGIDIEKVKLKPFSTRPFGKSSPTWRDGVVLVGEAAGIDRTTGEGIAQSIVMGGIAARHVAKGGPRFLAYDREVKASTMGRHMIQSAWLAKRVYGRSGAVARRYLLRSTFARDAATRWYRGDSLPPTTELRLLLGLASAIAPRRPQS